MKRQPNFGASKVEENARLSNEQKLLDRDVFEVEYRVKLAEMTKNKMEMVTIFHFTNMLKKSKNPTLFQIPNGDLQVKQNGEKGSNPLTRKGTKKEKKVPANAPLGKSSFIS